MPLPPSIQLRRSQKVTHDGRSDSGPLVADDTGLGVDVTTGGIIKRGTRKRYYVAQWSDITSYDISPAAQKNFAGSTVNGNDVVLTVTTPKMIKAFTIHLTDVARLTNRLGPYLARIRNEKSPAQPS